MKQVSYWHDTASAFTGAEPGPLPETTDVAVIGGGFTGLSAALALARRGASVVVLEADRVIGGASGRNGGHVNNGTSVDFGGLAERLGVDQARALYHAYDAAVDTVERIVQEEQITCSFRRGGKIKLAAKPAHYDKIARGFDLLHREADPETDLVPPKESAPKSAPTASTAGCSIGRAPKCIWASSVLGLRLRRSATAPAFSRMPPSPASNDFPGGATKSRPAAGQSPQVRC